MKRLKASCIILLLMLSVMIFPSTILAKEDDNATRTEVHLKKGEELETKNSEKKETIYTLDKAKPIKMLPRTGEIMTTFMYIMIGLSFLLFVTGLLLNKITKNDVRWEY